MKSLHRFIYSFHFLSQLLIASPFAVVGPTLHGQGTIAFQNIAAPGAIVNSLTGQPAAAGTTFSVAVYFAPDGVTDESHFTQLGAAANIGFVFGAIRSEYAGYFQGGTRTALLQPSGYFGMFQVRAWETIYGPTYEAAVANPVPQNGRLALVGESGIMRVDTGDPTIPEPGLPTSLVQPPPFVVAVVGAPLSEGFVLTVVPEPSPALLLLLSLASLFFFHRRPK